MRNVVFFLVSILLSTKSYSQTSTQDFGSATGSLSTSSASSTSFLPNPSNGTTYARIGTGGGSVNLENNSNPFGASGTYVRAVAPTSGSIVKFSPILDYTGTNQFYTAFNVMFGDASMGNTATSGTWYFFQGATGSTFNSTSGFTGTQVFVGLKFTFGSGGNITMNYRNGSSWSATNLVSSSLSSSTNYKIEIIGNNTLSTILSYDYNWNNGTTYTYSLATQKFDLFINGTLIGDDLTAAQLTAGSNINSTTFYAENSVGNVSNIFVDNLSVYNTVPGSILPVNINSFFVSKLGKINLLSWSTASEQNNSGFNIERSTNSTDFEIISFVKSLSSNGNSSSRLDYSFTDLNPIGLNQYYRLKQTDFDGTSKYSAIVMVTREAPTALTFTKVYPNPANGSIYVNASVPTKMVLQFLILDVAGRVITRKNVFADAGNNGFDISVEHLESGTYFIKAISKEQGVVATEKFIKF